MTSLVISKLRISIQRHITGTDLTDEINGRRYLHALNKQGNNI